LKEKELKKQKMEGLNVRMCEIWGRDRERKCRRFLFVYENVAWDTE
jgi:hypothetical protein